MRTLTSLARCSLTVVLLVALAPSTPTPVGATNDERFPVWKLGPEARQRAAARGKGWSRVIVSATDAAAVPRLRRLIEQTGGSAGRHLRSINGHVAYIPDAALQALARDPSVARISLDRPVAGSMARTSQTVRATDVRKYLGYDGSGIGVAIIDSGIIPSNADLTADDGQDRVIQFVDFVNDQAAPYDDYGHGTHVAGIIAGNGRQSGGARSGIAPGAHLVVLKALDDGGGGYTSNVIAALDYAAENKDALNIRVVNLSLATGVHESYTTDPLGQATRRAVEAGLVVVASAGNVGRDPLTGGSAYAGITAPGNAPWVLTVGASNHMGTNDRSDDTIAAFSSRGPTAVDNLAKPDIVAPGVGIESLSAPGSALYARLSPYLLHGTDESETPYLSLTGTSMSAPVVSGAVALMLQANPSLTPNQVKAILQYTARRYSGLDVLTQGGGFLNVKGAVDLAKYFADVSAGTSATYPYSFGWSGRIIWGNQSIGGGRLTPAGSAWRTDVTWGAALTPEGTNVSWGEICTSWDCWDGEGVALPWATSCADASCTAVTWGAGSSRNVVWDSSCGGADCQGPWTLVAAGSTISDLTQATTVVWGSDDGITVVWGSTVVWGTRCTDPACDPVIWNDE
ncbi:MAG: S8 family peptidase [Acidobacteriota bacterium]